jgi:predicted alpha/beta superfamily hydrolase
VRQIVLNITIMGKWIKLAGLVIIIGVIAAFLYSEITSEEQVREGSVLVKLSSKILGEERQLIIHLPKRYALDTTKNYPVMYVLDGSSEDGHTADKIETLATEGLIPEIIVVGIANISGESRNRDMTPPYMLLDIENPESGKGQADKFLAFLEQEVISYVANQYRTSGYNMFSGKSRGGLLVWYSLIEKPELFQARFSYSPALWREENLMVSSVEQFLAQNDSINTFLFSSLGDDENDKMKIGYYAMTKMLEEKAPKEFVWFAEYTPGANHDTNSELSTSRALKKWGAYMRTRNQ